MGMRNYMTNVVMIWRLNISTDLCCAGTPAIHPRKAATRDAWVCASNTWARCPARNIHDRLIAQGPREDGTVEKVLKIHHKSYTGKRWMDQEGKPSPTTLEIKTAKKKVLLDFPVVWILCSVKRVPEAEIDKGDWQLTPTRFCLVHHAMIWEVRTEKVAILNPQSARNPEQLNFPLRELKKEKWMTESSSLKLYFCLTFRGRSSILLGAKWNG